jgi:hypothetical protein
MVDAQRQPKLCNPVSTGIPALEQFDFGEVYYSVTWGSPQIFHTGSTSGRPRWR